MNPVDRLEAALAAVPGGTDNRHHVAGIAQRACLLPDPAVKPAGKGFYKEQDTFLPAHGIAPLTVVPCFYQHIPSYTPATLRESGMRTKSMIAGRSVSPLCTSPY